MALTQAQSPAPQGPGAEAPAHDGGALSDRLDKSNGVITPDRNLDPDMRRKPPPVNDPP